MHLAIPCNNSYVFQLINAIFGLFSPSSRYFFNKNAIQEKIYTIVKPIQGFIFLPSFLWRSLLSFEINELINGWLKLVK